MGTIKRDTLLANCRIRSESSRGAVGGSGTVIYSKPNSKGDYSSYILTNYHVVENNIKIETKWNPMLKRDIKADVSGLVEVHFFKYLYQSRAVGATVIEADILTYDVDEDLALLRLRDTTPTPSVATLFAKGEEHKLLIGMSVLAIGAGLGEPPIVTSGRLAQFAREIDNKEFWISTAPTIFGNSGGAVYLEDTGEFIGVPSRIAVILLGFAPNAIPHLSFITPITRVYKFLDDQLFRFIYNPAFTEDDEAALREQKRKEEERKVLAIIGDTSTSSSREERP